MIPQLSIILVNYNERDYLRGVLTALQQEFPSATEIVVVDNNSHDGSVAMVCSDFPTVTLIDPHTNLFYGKGNNLGLERVTGDWVMILNPDLTWTNGQLAKLVNWARTKPGVDLAAPQLRSRGGEIQISAHRRWPTLTTVFVDYCLPVQQLMMRFGDHPYQLARHEHMETQIIAHASGACLLVRREVIRTVGNFDPQFSMYLEETDWQKRMADAGFQSWFYAESQLTHFGSAQKSFAQASRHYFWGLRLYASKHWSLNHQSLLPPTVMIATFLSVLFLLIFFVPSFFLGRAGQRLRHYTGIYIALIGQIIRWPKHAPQS